MQEIIDIYTDTYTRAQAIEDGVLIDVSKMAREAGFRIPVAVTQRVWAEIIKPDDRSRVYGQSEEGRLWDVLYMCRMAIRHPKFRIKLVQEGPCEVLYYQLYVIMKKKQKRLITLKAHSGPGDNMEQVITIMMPDEAAGELLEAAY